MKHRCARLFPFMEQMRVKAGVDLKIITTCEMCRKPRLLFQRVRTGSIWLCFWVWPLAAFESSFHIWVRPVGKPGAPAPRNHAQKPHSLSQPGTASGTSSQSASSPGLSSLCQILFWRLPALPRRPVHTLLVCVGYHWSWHSNVIWGEVHPLPARGRNAGCKVYYQSFLSACCIICKF